MKKPLTAYRHQQCFLNFEISLLPKNHTLKLYWYDALGLCRKFIFSYRHFGIRFINPYDDDVFNFPNVYINDILWNWDFCLNFFFHFLTLINLLRCFLWYLFLSNSINWWYFAGIWQVSHGKYYSIKYDFSLFVSYITKDDTKLANILCCYTV